MVETMDELTVALLVDAMDLKMAALKAVLKVSL